jgi:hypothetical protein
MKAPKLYCYKQGTSIDNSFQALGKYKAGFWLSCKDAGKYKLLNAYFHITGKVVIFCYRIQFLNF